MMKRAEDYLPMICNWNALSLSTKTPNQKPINLHKQVSCLHDDVCIRQFAAVKYIWMQKKNTKRSIEESPPI